MPNDSRSSKTPSSPTTRPLRPPRTQIDDTLRGVFRTLMNTYRVNTPQRNLKSRCHQTEMRLPAAAQRLTEHATPRAQISAIILSQHQNSPRRRATPSRPPICVEKCAPRTRRPHLHIPSAFGAHLHHFFAQTTQTRRRSARQRAQSRHFELIPRFWDHRGAGFIPARPGRQSDNPPHKPSSRRRRRQSAAAKKEELSCQFTRSSRFLTESDAFLPSQTLNVATRSEFLQQLCQRRTTGQAAVAFAQGLMNGAPGDFRGSREPGGFLGRPISVPAAKRSCPAENLLGRQRRRVPRSHRKVSIQQ